MVYEKPTLTTELVEPGAEPQPAAAFILIAVLVAVDAGTWVWATRRITRATHSVAGFGPSRPALRVVVLPGASVPRHQRSSLIQIA
jgi:hypothetical protein